MDNRKLCIPIALATLVLAALACGGSFSTAKIQGARLSPDSEGAQETTVFAQDQTFYCIVDLANAPDDTTVKAVWTAVEAQGVEPDYVIDQTELASGDATLTFNLSNDMLWPLGTYKVDLYLNGQIDRTLNFEVR